LDYKAEFDRLTKEKMRLEEEVSRVKGKLSNEGFVAKAPEKVILEEKQKQLKYEDMLEKVGERLLMVFKKL
jgi:valyl-tRNA synthetase